MKIVLLGGFHEMFCWQHLAKCLTAVRHRHRHLSSPGAPWPLTRVLCVQWKGRDLLSTFIDINKSTVQMRPWPGYGGLLGVGNMRSAPLSEAFLGRDQG